MYRLYVCYYQEKILRQIDEQPNLPQNLTADERQRIENLKDKFDDLKKRFETIQISSNPSNINHIIENTENLIKYLKEFEEQIRTNSIQPISNYERLIPDCQVTK